jgi:hypothetical protein
MDPGLRWDDKKRPGMINRENWDNEEKRTRITKRDERAINKPYSSPLLPN